MTVRAGWPTFAGWQRRLRVRGRVHRAPSQFDLAAEAIRETAPVFRRVADAFAAVTAALGTVYVGAAEGDQAGSWVEGYDRKAGVLVGRLEGSGDDDGGS